MTVKPNRVRIDPNDVVKCPECDLTNLHHTSIEIFNRSAEDAAVGLHVRVEGSAVYDVDDSMRGNPSPRRGGLYIRFTCETCDAKPILKMIQHKGSTYLNLSTQTQAFWMEIRALRPIGQFLTGRMAIDISQVYSYNIR